MASFNSLNKGFTIVEVTIAILVFLIGISIVVGSYINIIRNHLISQQVQVSLGNLRLALDKIFRDAKYGVDFEITPNEIVFERSYDCKESKIFLESGILKHKLDNNTSSLTDKRFIEIISFNVYATGSLSGDAYYHIAPKLILLSLTGNAKIPNSVVPFNMQISIAPINSVFAISVCP